MTQKRKFKRKKSTPLTDQSRNPGGLNVGRFATRYGTIARYTYRGNTTAVFATRGHGIAALMDWILSKYRHYGPVTVENYLVGGGGIRKHRSYSGGQMHYADSYIKAMRQKGVKPNEKLDGSIRQLQRLVKAHAFAEGGKVTLTQRDFNTAIDLLLERSPNLAGTELEALARVA